jgi:predicted TIM-barrel fold metal-dependent hydrolase
MCVILFPISPYINSKECNNLYIIYFKISDLQQKADDAKIRLSPSHILFTTDFFPCISYKMICNLAVV